jgi:endonuclease/exonuclease/phosphatase family metal-dependent hydrolase
MTVRFATFNLKDFFLPRKPAEAGIVEAKVANVAANLRRANADVVALQEVGSTELLDRLLTRELSDLGYGTPLVGTEDRRGIRNVILSRLPVLWSQVHTARSLPFPRLVEGDPEPFPGRIPLRRGIVHVRVDGGDIGEIDVMTAHFKSNLPAALKDVTGRDIKDDTPRGRGEAAVRSLVQRAAEAIFLRGLVDDVFRALPDHAVCVMGDLNDLVDSMAVRIVCGIGEPEKERLRPCAELLPAEKRFSCIHRATPSLIDHVLVSEKVFRAVRRFEIFNEALRYHGPHVDQAPLTEDSDHALSVAELEG